MKSSSLLLLGVVCAGMYAGICAAQEVTPAGIIDSTAQQAQRKVQGKVVQQDGQGIRKVKVILRGRQEYSAITDENGQFTIESVEAGTYLAQLERSGYAPDQKSSRERRIKVVAEQDTVDLILHMVAAGALSGKIVDLDGDPLRDVSVDATASTTGAIGGRLTNELGEYRIPDLPPGKYLVSATPPDNETPPPGPHERKNPKERMAYVTTYFPGTSDKQQAAVVEVLAGATATADFSVQTSRVYRVSGAAVGLSRPPIPKTSEGESENPIVESFVGWGQILLVGKTGQSKEQNLGQDGKFEFTNVLPGTYQAQLIVISQAGLVSSSKMQRIRTPIEVNGSDVDGLQLQWEPSVEVSGKFRMDDNEKTNWKGLSVALLEVPEPGAEHLRLEGIGPTGMPKVNQDGSFEMKDVAAGEYQLAVIATSDKYRDYYTKSVLLRGQEVADTGFAVDPGTVLDVVVSAKGAGIEGTVVDGAGKPVADAQVVTVPSSGKLGRPDAYQSGQTDEKGHFVLRGMNPGQFVVLAFDELQEACRTPEFAKKYETQGEKVELEEGVKKSVVVKLIQGQ